MAFIHTNFLTGNDSTGDGTTGLPYKTVYKALTVAASADTIKVAGGQWSANLAGNFTFTQNSNVITTSVSQVGTVLVDDILSFEDGQFGFDKFHIKVLAVTAGSITTCLFWPMATTTVNDVRRIETYHYSQAAASPTALETWSTTDIQPAGRTGITISGGWNNTFDTQGGWTVGRRTGQAITVTNTTPQMFSITATGGLGQWNDELIFDKFMVHTISMFSIGTTATGSSFAVGNIALIKGQLNAGTGFFGLWQPAPLVPSNFYMTSTGSLSTMNNINAYQPGNNSRPEAYECNIWATLTWNTVNTQNTSNGNFGMSSQQVKEGSINQTNIKIRQNSWTSNGIAGNPASIVWTSTSRGNYIKSLEWYANVPQMVYIYGGANTITQIEDLTLSGPSAAQTCIYFQGSSSAQYIVDLAAESKRIDDYKLGYGSYGPVNGFYTESSLVELCQSNLQLVQVRDSEGLKTVDYNGSIYFKDNGNLKVSSGTSFSDNSSTFYMWKVIGVIDKPVASFTVTFTLKTDTGAEADWDKLAVQYGPTSTQIIEQALTPTDAFATYTMTIDPASYSDWTKFSFPLYFGIRAKSANTYDSETMSYAYIQSISIV